ncbi:MAG TPA: tRNA uridine-5-carboxymethylaminomethyl(34) synthesis GTPase MnmE [Caulobacteraceae bacterium]|jgi:tRNA modification GTPase|nr:tRNA uridine-5-carboxymethylaminomethyl(34) synthesis GTPase MnmE [Caulobacteraceae bacterium]
MNVPIAAVATAPGAAALAVIRISAPNARPLLRALGVKAPPPRRARLAAIRNNAGELIDRGLVIFFPAPASYTGEDVVELHLHGGRAVVAAAMEAVLAAGARLAEPGEFTRRAFETGKLDLDQAEAVADVVDAQTSAQARQALSQLQGDLGRRYLLWRERLTSVLARLEAGVDFPDEDVDIDATGVAAELAGLHADMAAALAHGGRGLQIREGYRVALIGAPNAGKSTLFNALLARDAAIVTDTPGTTRDVIEAALDVAGYRVLLADMAGLRSSGDPIEAEGVRRARAWAQAADLRLWLVDASADGEAWREGLDLVREGDFAVFTKADLAEGPAAAFARHAVRGLGLAEIVLEFAPGFPGLACVGPQIVLRTLGERVVEALSGGDFPALTRRRHGEALAAALVALERAQGTGQAELAAEDVRLAARELEKIQGRIGVEAVLDSLFLSFCIGK